MDSAIRVGCDRAALSHKDKDRTYLLELSLPHEPILAMLRTCGPTDRVVSIEFNTSPSLVLVNDLETVIVDEHVRGTALEFIGGDGLFDRLDCGRNDRVQTFLVHRALHSDVRQSTVPDPRRSLCRVELRVHLQLSDGTETLRETTDYDLSEELDALISLFDTLSDNLA